jgi:hypothetical protein
MLNNYLNHRSVEVAMGLNALCSDLRMLHVLHFLLFAHVLKRFEQSVSFFHMAKIVKERTKRQQLDLGLISESEFIGERHAQCTHRHSVVSEVIFGVFDIEHRLYGPFFFHQELNIATGAVFCLIIVRLTFRILENCFGAILLRPLDNRDAILKRLRRLGVVGLFDILRDVAAVSLFILRPNEHLLQFFFTQSI